MKNNGADPTALPMGITLLERGWLSSNNVVLHSADECVLVDSGYVGHAKQTLALVTAEIGPRPLSKLVNTHLHSDHCGGNALLQSTFPGLQTYIAPGESAFVKPWTPDRLSHEATGQRCAPFSFDGLLVPGQHMQLASRDWEVISAPGHDPHAVMLWCKSERVLISADALWENGFGIVFPELTDQGGFDEVESTLNTIEKLAPRWILPGHGRAISDATGALARARSRLEQFRRNPAAHTHHAIKALLKFLLLDKRQMDWGEVREWVVSASLMRAALAQGCAKGYAIIDPQSAQKWQTQTPAESWVATAVEQLVSAGVIASDDHRIWDI
jgi:glyoxylase-like metal-dependent hydrolase (beta-lactamase superfamily II)